MDVLGFQPSLLLLLSLWAPSIPASTLEGSCVEAGFTECCDLEVDGLCFAPPTFCLCDPSCREHGDCCEDIDELCPPEHPEPVPPVLLLTLDATYHTATLRWGVPPEAPTNQTYRIIYWDYHTPNTTFYRNISRQDEGVISDGQTMRYTLTGLTPGVLYQWSIETSTESNSLQSEVSNFSTMTIDKLERLSVKVYDTTSVEVTWAPPQLPLGVRLLSYTVHYVRTRSSSSSENPRDSGQYVTAWESVVVVSGLRSNSFYQFWVEGSVVEGAVESEDIIRSGNMTVFLPDSTIVQLRGGPFKPCRNWTDSTEVEALRQFRHAINQTILSDNDGGRELIERDFVLCENSSSSAGSHAVYRASVFSSPDLTTEAIRSLLEEGVATGRLSELLVDKTCPVSVSRASQPICRPAENTDSSKDCDKPSESPETNTVTGSLTNTDNCTCREPVGEEVVVTVPLLVTALVAELFLVVFVVLLVTAVVMVVRRRYLEGEKSVPHSPAQPNEYS